MSAKVQINLSGENDVELNLAYQIKNNDMLISLQDNEGGEIISDKLSQFSSINIDDSNALKITLKGPKFSREITFEKENEASDFFLTIQKIAKLTQLPGEKRSLLITIMPQQAGVTDYVPLLGFLNKTISTTYKTVKTIMKGKDLEVPKEESVVEADGFTLGYIHKSISDVALSEYDTDSINDNSKILTADSEIHKIDFSKTSAAESDLDLLRITESLQRISSLTFTESQIYSIWNKFLLPRGVQMEQLYEDYQKIKAQWTTLLKGQWTHSFSLRSFVYNSETLIKESKILSTLPYNRIAFDVLISLFSFHFSKLNFDPHFIQVLEILIPTCIKSYKNNAPAQNETNSTDISNFEFETHLGEIFNDTEICSTIFWMFKTFSEQFVISKPSKKKENHYDETKLMSILTSHPSGNTILNQISKPSLGELFLCVKTQLSIISPSTNDLLENVGIHTLDFCKEDIDAFFIRNKNLSDSQLFLTAMMSSSNIVQFNSSVLSSILVLLQSRLQHSVLNFDSQDLGNDFGNPKEASEIELFKTVLETSLGSLDTRLILYNEEGLHGNRNKNPGAAQ